MFFFTGLFGWNFESSPRENTHTKIDEPLKSVVHGVTFAQNFESGPYVDSVYGLEMDLCAPDQSCSWLKTSDLLF